MLLSVSDAVNDNQRAKFWDKDAKAAVTSKEEAFKLSNLAGAKSGLEGPLREKSIAEELAMPNEARTWGMADAPAGIVGWKQIFWATKGPAASLVCCEARLVVLFETFVPVARLSSICTVLAIAAARNHCTSQIDMESAYTEKLLTSDEVISMKQPPGLFQPPSIRQNLRLLSSRNLL